CPSYSISSFFSFFFSYPVHHRNLHSFPTRRSSDLVKGELFSPNNHPPGAWLYVLGVAEIGVGLTFLYGGLARVGAVFLWIIWVRSEEHTSELQSRVDLVCRLLLEKKKKLNKLNDKT